MIDEYISVDAARNEYGVVIDPKSTTVDLEATKRLRQAGRPMGVGDKAPMAAAAAE